MDLRKLKTLIDLVSDSNVSELEITEAEGKVRIVKGSNAVVQSYAPAPIQTTPLAVAPLPVAPTEAAAPEVPAIHAVRSPMVGTFYRAPQPGAAPYVEIGAPVASNTIIAIIEVMKLMCSIPALTAGTVHEILVQDAQLVEKGQLLMRVKPGPV